MSKTRRLGNMKTRPFGQIRPTLSFVSTYPPTKCGLATYTTHLVEALERHDPRSEIRVAAMTPGPSPDYGPRVRYDLSKEDPQAYVDLARHLNADGTDVVSLQHEYGIFGGAFGEYALKLLANLRRPVVTTLHTVLSEPHPEQKRVLIEVARLSRQVVVMSSKGVDLLQEIYQVPAQKITMIPHGAPAGIPAEIAKAKLGLQGHTVISTFGLLSRGKGLEYALEAFIKIAKQHPDTVYLILGTTHPNVIASEGESYREALAERVRDEHLEERVRFVNRYLTEKELVEWLSATDIYLTPYINGQQITSGTLAYAVAQGKAVISTPYLYAQELLAGGRGLLSEFRSSESLAQNLSLILDRPELREQLEERSRNFGRTLLWPTVAAQYANLFRRVAAEVSRPQHTSVPTDNFRSSLGPPERLAVLEGTTYHRATANPLFPERSIGCLPRRVGSSLNPASPT